MLHKDKTRINLTITKEMYKEFKDACYWERVTMSEILLKSIMSFLTKSAKKSHKGS